MSELKASEVATRFPDCWKEWSTSLLEILRDNDDELEDFEREDDDIDLDTLENLLDLPDEFVKLLSDHQHFHTFEVYGHFVVAFEGVGGGPSAEALWAWDTRKNEALDCDPYDCPELLNLMRG